MVGQIDGFAHLGKGGRPARGNDIPDLEAVAWSLWLASQACSSLNQPERLPMLDVLTYLFFEINNRITSKGAIRPSYRGSNAEELYGRLWSRLSFVGFDQALYNSSPMPNLEPSAELVSKRDQYIIYSLVRVLRGTLDYDFEKKNRKEEFDFTNLGGGAKKAIHIFYGTDKVNNRTKDQLLKIWKRYNCISHVLYACEASEMHLASFLQIRIGILSIDEQRKIAQVVSMSSLTANWLTDFRPVGSSDTSRVIGTSLFNPARSFCYEVECCRNFISDLPRAPDASLSKAEIEAYEDYNSAEG